MVKKVFDKSNLPSIDVKSADLIEIMSARKDQELFKGIEGLDACTDPEDSLEYLAEILSIATEISEQDWERGCEIVKKNVIKIQTRLSDDLIMDIIDMAINDPKIEDFRNVAKIWMETKGFKELTGIPDVEEAMPKEGALSLLDLALGYAETDSTIFKETSGLLNAIDPYYQLPEGAGFELH